VWGVGEKKEAYGNPRMNSLFLKIGCLADPPFSVLYALHPTLFFW